MVGKVNPVGKVIAMKPRKKRPKPEDFKPFRPPDGAA